MTNMMEQVVTQLQQELLALKAQVAARVQIAAVTQARLLATTQARKDASSLIDVAWDAHRNSLARKRISNSGRKRPRYLSLE